MREGEHEKEPAMPYELLPRDEPGKPLMRVPPGFADRVLQRFKEQQRQQRRRRTAILVTAVVLVAIMVGAYLLYLR